MSDYFLRQGNGAVTGPFTSTRLREMASNGHLRAMDCVSIDSGANWVVANKVRGLRELIAFAAGESTPSNTADAQRDRQPDPSPFDGVSLEQATIDLVHEAPGRHSSYDVAPPPTLAPSHANPRTMQQPTHAPATNSFDDWILHQAFRASRMLFVLLIVLCVLALIFSVLASIYMAITLTMKDQPLAASMLLGGMNASLFMSAVLGLLASLPILLLIQIERNTRLTSATR